MSNDYAIGLLIDERLGELRREAAQDRLAREARSSRPGARRWWERLMLFRGRTVRRPTPTAPLVTADSHC